MIMYYHKLELILWDLDSQQWTGEVKNLEEVSLPCEDRVLD